MISCYLVKTIKDYLKRSLLVSLITIFALSFFYPLRIVIGIFVFGLISIVLFDVSKVFIRYFQNKHLYSSLLVHNIIFIILSSTIWFMIVMSLGDTPFFRVADKGLSAQEWIPVWGTLLTILNGYISCFQRPNIGEKDRWVQISKIFILVPIIIYYCFYINQNRIEEVSNIIPLVLTSMLASIIGVSAIFDSIKIYYDWTH